MNAYLVQNQFNFVTNQFNEDSAKLCLQKINRMTEREQELNLQR